MTILQCLSATDSETEEEVEYSYHAGVSLSPMGQPLATPLSQPKITSSTPIIHALHTDSTQIAADNPVQQGNIQQNTIDKNKHTPAPPYKPITKSQPLKASINKRSWGPHPQLSSDESIHTSTKKINRKRKLPTQFKKTNMKLTKQ